MRNIIFGFVITLISCASSDSDILESDLRKCNVSLEVLKSGLVKVYKVESKKGTFTFYDRLEMSSDNEFTLLRYKDDFKLIREDTYLITNKSYTLTKMCFFSPFGKEMPVKITKPRKISFDPKETELTSQISYEPQSGVSIVTIDKTEVQNKEENTWNGKPIDCLRFKITTQKKITDSNNDQDFETIDKGYILFGDKIGWCYSETINNGDKTIFKLLKVLTIKEFEELKL